MMQKPWMVRRVGLWLGCLLATPAWATGQSAPVMDVPQMVERAEAAGLIHSYEGGWEYFVGGGAASFDCNGDRKPELLIAGGTSPAQFFINRSVTGGELAFEKKDIGISANLLTKVSGAYPLDIDNDGYQDIVVLRLGRNLVLKGGPDCTFENAANDFEFDGGREWTTAFSATFEAGQTFPTLAFGNYVDRTAPGTPWGTCHDNVLMRPQPGIDTPSYSQLELLTPSHCTLSMTFTDWDRSGRRDLRVTNDRQYYRGGQEQLWRMEPGRAAREYTSSDGWRSVTIWGMGIATADLDADGLPEFALTSMGDTKLQTLDDEADEGTPVYRDIAFERGATAHRPYTGEAVKPSTGWHAEFADFNNDGRNDLFIAKGNVEQMPDFAAFDPDNMLLGDHQGSFVEAGDRAGIALDTKGRGAIIEDFNHDGMLDLMVVNRSQNVSLFQSTGAVTDKMPRMMGNWLAIELQQDGANRDGIGARIAVKSGNDTRIRFVDSGGGHASGKAGFVHVGLGVAERAQIRVQWPDGEWSAPYRVFANQFVVIKRGNEQARYWLPE
ncbi:MAG: CRTAC1 family protein [Ahrensia sp.]